LPAALNLFTGRFLTDISPTGLLGVNIDFFENLQFIEDY
jgi:hypothetical protein